jgi:2-C-methyl-D-erythritol 4-phosphate cytidylyltransferase
MPHKQPQTSRPTNSNKEKFWVIVPAAGVGRRMAQAVPKQYLKVCGKTILEHSIERLLQAPSIAGVLVCVARNDELWSELGLEKNDRVKSVYGGNERMHSVYNALNYLKKELDVADRYILVHDAVRPCVSIEDIERLISKVVSEDVGGILASPAVDTLKRVDKDFTIVETIERNKCWRAQTPQMFRLSIMQKSIEVLLNRNMLASDESAAVEASGFKSMIVEGSQQNIKLTMPEDLTIIEAILNAQKGSEKEPEKERGG